MPARGADDTLSDALRALGDGRVFFAFGIPKSGTTFLQMILNSHPEVSCPSEHQFEFLIRKVAALLTTYNKVLLEVDRRTARQGATLLTDDDVTVVLRATFLAIMGSAGRRKGARLIGANDNAIVTQLPLFLEIFPTARFICVVRDPRDTILSQWHHNLRIEADFLQRARTLDHWIDFQSKQWQTVMAEISSRSDQEPLRQLLLITRYEDLAAGDSATFNRLFEHLGASSGMALIDQIIEQTAFPRVKARSHRNVFFRRGAPGAWREEMTPRQVEVVLANARAMMARFDYA
jgi:hypothetical protein